MSKKKRAVKHGKVFQLINGALSEYVAKPISERKIKRLIGISSKRNLNTEADQILAKGKSKLKRKAKTTNQLINKGK